MSPPHVITTTIILRLSNHRQLLHTPRPPYFHYRNYSPSNYHPYTTSSLHLTRYSLAIYRQCCLHCHHICPFKSSTTASSFFLSFHFRSLSLLSSSSSSAASTCLSRTAPTSPSRHHSQASIALHYQSPPPFVHSLSRDIVSVSFKQTMNGTQVCYRESRYRSGGKVRITSYR